MRVSFTSFSVSRRLRWQGRIFVSENPSIEECWQDRDQLEQQQLQRLQQLIRAILPRNRFWNDRFLEAGLSAQSFNSLDDLKQLPLCTKADLVADQEQHPPYGSNLTFPSTAFRRLHQTSGTTGRPIRWLDTADSWNWILECWRQIYQLAGVNSWDRLFFPFSFGPFLGFWAAFDGAQQAGHFCIAGGGMTTSVRLRALLENEATVLCCTPTYALRMAEVAAAEGLDLQESSVRMLIVAGEAGGTIPATRKRIEDVWDARVIDHWGMTEIGSLAVESEDRPGGMYLLETECIAEILLPDGSPAAAGQSGELILTNLGRHSSPLLRYRTGDIVTVSASADPAGRCLKWLDGGITGRVDDMIVVRGNNLFPSSIEAVLREFPEVQEFQIEVSTARQMTELCIVVEPTPAAAAKIEDLHQRVTEGLRQRLGFAVAVRMAAVGDLPRSEMKSRRLVNLIDTQES